MLEGFKIYNLTTGLPTLSITQNGVSFNKTAIVKMEYPEYVVLMINYKEKRIAIQSCSKELPGATVFYKGEKRNGIVSVRWNNRELLNTISKMMRWDLSKQGYRIPGDYLETENAIIFDLNQAEIIE